MNLLPEEASLLKCVRRVAKNQKPGTKVEIRFVDFTLPRPNVGYFSICVLSSHQVVILLNIEEQGQEEKEPTVPSA